MSLLTFRRQNSNFTEQETSYTKLEEVRPPAALNAGDLKTLKKHPRMNQDIHIFPPNVIRAPAAALLLTVCLMFLLLK